MSPGLESNGQSVARREADKVFGEGKVKVVSCRHLQHSGPQACVRHRSYWGRPLMGRMYHTGRRHAATGTYVAQVLTCDLSRQAPHSWEKFHTARTDGVCTPIGGYRNGRRGRCRRARRGAPIRTHVQRRTPESKAGRLHKCQLHFTARTLPHHFPFFTGCDRAARDQAHTHRAEVHAHARRGTGMGLPLGLPLGVQHRGHLGAPQGGVGLLLKKGWTSRLVPPSTDDPVQQKLWPLGRWMHVRATLGGWGAGSPHKHTGCMWRSRTRGHRVKLSGN